MSELSGVQWFEAFRPYEQEIVEATARAEVKARALVQGLPAVGLAKQVTTALVRQALAATSVPFATLESGNREVDYLLFPDTAIVRVKGLRRGKRPSNYQTQTAQAYHLGDGVFGLPPLPRVDLSYVMDEFTYEIRSLALLEWQQRIVVGRYQLPWSGMPREIEEHLMLPLETETEVAATEEAKRRRERNTQHEGEREA